MTAPNIELKIFRVCFCAAIIMLSSSLGSDAWPNFSNICDNPRGESVGLKTLSVASLNN